jgi:HPt (histidine-containing phosphotransfer) domain-containing protein
MSENPPIIDFPEALSRTLGDVAFLQSMLFEFQSFAPDFLNRIHQALQNGDVDRLARDTHQFKGAAANLSIKRVAVLALELEKMGKNGNCDNGTNVFNALKEAVRQFSSLLDQTDFSTFCDR